MAMAETAAEPGSTGRSAARLTASQLRIFDDLLAIGGPRPVMPAGMVEDLRQRIAHGVAGAMAAWPESTMWTSKSTISTVLRCEGQVVADASAPRRRGIVAATATGIVVHRAIQLDHTHPGRTPQEVVAAAVAGSRAEEAFGEWWEAADISAQSDLLVTATNQLCSFLDTFPPLERTWVPRFEDSTVARIGGLVLAARPDLSLGRPRGDGRQTMFLCDFKSSDLRAEHFDEAMFYALVATLRNGCAPFRSCVLSLASGEWTDPDVTPDRLEAAADAVIAAVNARVEVLTEARDAELNAGFHCTWCPAKTTCPAASAWEEAGRPSTPLGPIRVAPALITLPGNGPEAETSIVTETREAAELEVVPVAAAGDNPWLVD